MTLEINLFTEAQELIIWMQKNDIFYDMNQKDAELLLEYMNGNDYQLGTDKEGNLVRLDMASEKEEMEMYSMDDVIDWVCELNYEDILDAENMMDDPTDVAAYFMAQNRLESLRQDEKRLDHLFEQTKYHTQIEELAQEIAQGIIKKALSNQLQEGQPLFSKGITEVIGRREKVR